MSATKLKERPSPPAAGATAYDTDFYSWTIEQAAALREGRMSVLDVENLAEEIEELGKEVFNKLASSFRVILVHMLKWDHQPERRSRSWVGSIEMHRLDIEDVIRDNPALRRRQQEAIERAFRQARIKAAVEMKRDKASLPTACPYSLEDILNRPFEWPTH